MSKVINKNGKEFDFDATVLMMDDDVREQLNSELAPCSEQEFFTAYEFAHENKYDQEWELSKSNPVW
jgi:hypothetical protein